MLGLRPQIGVGDVQGSAQLDLSLSILVHFIHVELSEAGGPRDVIWAHAGIEVAQENKLFIVRDAADDGCEVFVELVFVSDGADIVGAYTLTRVTGPAVMLSRRVRVALYHRCLVQPWSTECSLL